MKKNPEICIPAEMNAESAWQLINQGKDWHTLFVQEKDGKISASLTDGDIRRGLLSGLNLRMPVSAFANRKFVLTSDTPETYISFRALAEKGILRIPVLQKEGAFSGYYDTTEQNAVLPVEALVLAGGKGQRMLPLTLNTPKSLLPVQGVPMLGRITDQLIQSGVQKITFALHHEAERIRAFCEEWVADRIDIQFIEEERPLGTAGSLSLLQPVYPYVLVMNSDLLTDLDPEQMYLNIVSGGQDILLAAASWKTEIPYALIQCTDSGELLSLEEKPVMSFPVNAGIYLLKSTLTTEIQHAQKVDMPDLLNQWMLSGKRAGVYFWNGVWQDMGRPVDYERFGNPEK